MEKDIYSQLKELRKTIRLSDKEKRSGREFLLARMNAREPANKHIIPSPFRFWFSIRAHQIVTASLILVVVLATSVSVSASGALPDHYLYPVKVKVMEPIQTLFTNTPEEKAQRAVKLVDKRLQELSKVSAKKKLDKEDRETFHGYLSSQISTAHKEIKVLADNNKTYEAVDRTLELQSVLSANDIILSKLDKKDPDSEKAEDGAEEDLSSEVEEGSGTTAEIINELEDMIEKSDNETELDELIEKQSEANKVIFEELAEKNDEKKNKEGEAREDISEKSEEKNSGEPQDELKSEIDEIVAEDKRSEDENENEDESINTERKETRETDMEARLSEISIILKEAERKALSGEKKRSFQLHRLANQSLRQTKYLLDSGYDLSSDNENNVQEENEGETKNKNSE